MTNCKRTIEFAKKMNCKMPDNLVEMFKGLDKDQETRKLLRLQLFMINVKN